MIQLDAVGPHWYLVVVSASFDQGEVLAGVRLSILAVQPLVLLTSTRNRRSRLVEWRIVALDRSCSEQALSNVALADVPGVAGGVWLQWCALPGADRLPIPRSRVATFRNPFIVAARRRTLAGDRLRR